MGNGNNEARLPALVDAGITPGLAALAHEINSPLEALLNLLFLLEREPKLTKKGQHYLDLAREEVRRIAEIAQEALHQETHAPTRRQRTDVAALLGAVLDFYKLRLDSAGVTVTSSHYGDDNVAADDGHLRQALRISFAMRSTQCRKVGNFTRGCMPDTNGTAASDVGFGLPSPTPDTHLSRRSSEHFRRILHHKE